MDVICEKGGGEDNQRIWLNEWTSSGYIGVCRDKVRQAALLIEIISISHAPQLSSSTINPLLLIWTEDNWISPVPPNFSSIALPYPN